MGNALVFTLCSAIFLLAGYLGYKCLLSSCKQPAFNRAVILAVYALSALWFLFPEITVNIPSDLSGGISIGKISAAIAGATDGTAGFSWTETIITVWICGMVFFLTKTVIGIISLVRYIRRGRRIRQDGYTLVITDDAPHSPFSWMRYVVIHKADVADDRLIVSHEIAHIRRRHTLDLIIAQIFCIVQWFNPGAWLMKEELESVHEYQADEDVLGEGVNLKDYQLILIKKTVGNRFHQLTNSLNHSQLKKRLTMMMKSKSKRSARLGAAVLLPAMLAAAVVVNLPEVASAMDLLRPDKVSGLTAEMQTAKVKVTDSDNTGSVAAEPAAEKSVTAETAITDNGALLAANSSQAKKKSPKKLRTISKGTIKTNDPSKVIAYENVSDEDLDVYPAYPGGDMALINHCIRNMVYPAEAFVNKIQGDVIVSFIVDTDGSITDVKVANPVHPALDAEALRVVKAIPKKFSPGKKDGKAVKTTINLPVKFKLK